MNIRTAKNWTRSLLVGVFLILAAPSFAFAQLDAVLTWSGDADLDLEIWDASAHDPIGKAYNLGGSRDDQGPDGRESFSFTGDFERGVYVLAVSYLSGNTEQVPVTLTISEDGDVKGTYRAEVNLTDQSLWYVVRVNAATGELESVDRYW